MFYYILNIKMTSQSLSNFCIERGMESSKNRRRVAVKSNNDREVTFMFKMYLGHRYGME